MVAIAIAPMLFTSHMSNYRQVYNSNKGTVIVVIMLGMASRRICLFNNKTFTINTFLILSKTGNDQSFSMR